MDVAPVSSPEAQSSPQQIVETKTYSSTHQQQQQRLPGTICHNVIYMLRYLDLVLVECLFNAYLSLIDSTTSELRSTSTADTSLQQRAITQDAVHAVENSGINFVSLCNISYIFISLYKILQQGSYWCNSNEHTEFGMVTV